MKSYFTILSMFAVIPIIAFKIRKFDYEGWANLCRRVILALTGNLSFTPSPSIAALQSALDDLILSWDVWQNKTIRSHADLLDLRQKCNALANLLYAEAGYITSASRQVGGSDVTVIESLILSAGFYLKNSGQKQGKLEAVRNLRQVTSSKLDVNQCMIDWEKPANVTSNVNVKNYRVVRSLTSSMTAAVEIALVSKTSFIDTNLGSQAQVYYYGIIPVGTDGNGVASEMIRVTIPSLS